MKLFLIVALSIMSAITWAQNPAGGSRSGAGQSGMVKEGSLKGQVIESSQGTPMEFVNIVLFSSGDSAMVTGTITDESGKFSLTDLSYGRFYMTVNFIGFERKLIDSIFINPNNKITDFGTIRLKSAATNLQGIEIVGDKARVVYQVDKKIINVSQDLKSAGGTAIDVLENIPSVKVDIEGNVTMRGSGSFTVLIDGRPSVLEASDALQQIPSTSIDHIEIITNPSVKFDPDGTAGIINVVTKKQTERGLNGIINASVGTKNKYTGDFLLNYRMRKVNVFGGIDYRKRQFSGKGESLNENYLSDTTQVRKTYGENKMNRDGYGIKAGVDYIVSRSSNISLSGRYGFYSFGRDYISKMLFTSYPQTEDYYTTSENSTEREGNYYEVTANFLHKFDDKGHKLEVMGFFSGRTGDDEEYQAEYPTGPEWQNPGSPTSQILTAETDQTYDYLVKADYVLPLDQKTKFEAGYQSRFFNDLEDYVFLDYDTVSNAWIENELYTNEIDFRRNIHSAYSTFSSEWKGFGYQLGLRGEYSDRNVQNTRTGEEYPLSRFDAFPSVHLSKQFLENNQFLLSYSRRINRVRGRMLDPSVSYWDPYNMRKGNPNLKDEYIDSYDLGYQRKFNTSYLALEAYYRVTHNKITSIVTLQDDGIYLRTYDNLNKDYSLGTELSGNFDITRWLNLFASADLFYYRLKGMAEGAEVEQSSFDWDSKLTASFRLKYDIRLQLTASYDGPSVTLQGRDEGNFMSSFSARKDFFDRKLSVTLSARDLFRSAKYESTTSGKDFYTHSKMQRESPVIMLNLSYRINNYRQVQQRQENGEMNGGDDLEM